MSTYDDVIRDLAERVALGDSVDRAIDDGLIYTEDVLAILRHQLGDDFIRQLFAERYCDFYDDLRADILDAADEMA